ncbi:MAG: FHA domain-containing protein [Deltaproteobacteria bacterium]|nr:MAG: FHA domain-containing protein [Deltaproteobacteria bacterium]
MPSLNLITNDGRSLNFPISKDKITIGRSEDCDLTLTSDKTVSRSHAQIEKIKEGYLLTDLGSYNRTKVNEKLVQSVLLKHNDKIRIGRTNLIFLTKKKESASPEDSLVLTTDSDYEKEHNKILRTPSGSGLSESDELLVSIEDMKLPKEGVITAQPEETEADSKILERSNKVLRVLYDISSQLTSITDFRELLKRIMDNIFRVIDADYGFLLLTGDGEEDQLTPVVVKHKDDKEKDKETLKVSRTIIDKVIHDKEAILTSDAMADSRFDGSKSVFLQKIRSAMYAPLWRKDTVIGVIGLNSVRFDNQFTQDDLKLLEAIGSQSAMILEQASLNEQIREEEILRSRLERFLSPQVAEMIATGSQETIDNVMEPTELTATIVFTDIIAFTRLAEKIPPRETNMILNQYFSMVTDIIFRHDGTLDKYIGDGLMAVFGAPMERQDDAERAILAAKEMREKLAAMMAKKEGYKRKFDIRIGINTGRVVAGNIGSPRRMDYTVIGDPVNIASRLESIAKPNQILIGEETYEAIKNRFEIRKIGPQKVKGKSAEIMVYEVT